MIEITENRTVLRDGVEIGRLIKFCCGIDYIPNTKHGSIFSILKAKYGTKKLIKCIEALSELKMPNRYFHFNFNYDIAKDKSKLKDYQQRLLLTN